MSNNRDADAFKDAPTPAPVPRPLAVGDVIPLHEQFVNHDEFKREATDKLAGTELTLHFGGGGSAVLSFGAERVSWTATQASPWGTEGVDEYEAVPVRDGYAITVSRTDANASALVFLDIPAGRALINLTQIAPTGTDPVATTVFVQAGIDTQLADRFESTTELLGKRLAQRYSTTHVFEHIYLNPNTYAWHGLSGPEGGVADVDAADYYKLGDELYLFSWHERSQPFNGAIVIDLQNRTGDGRLVGWDQTLGRTLQTRVGSTVKLLSAVVYG